MSVGALSLMPPLSPRILMAATLVGAACGFSPAALGAPRSAARRVALPRPVMEMEVWFAAIKTHLAPLLPKMLHRAIV